MIDKSVVQKHFDRHAKEYDQYARVQDYMADQLMVFLQQDIAQSRLAEESIHIFEIGCGTGFLTHRLLKQYPHAQLTVMDISDVMLDTLKTKLHAYAHRLHCVHADAEKYEFDSAVKFDMILSNATFQWFNDPQSTVSQYVKHLNFQGILAFATFAPLTFQELYTCLSMAHEHLQLSPYRYGLTYPSKEDWTHLFQNQISGDFTWKQEVWIEHFAELRQFLYAIQRIGATQANIEEAGSVQTRRLTKQILTHAELLYEARYRDKEGIQVTYDIGFGIYQKQDI